MHIVILTFEGFNELDSLIALNILNRVKRPGWRVSIASPSARVRSMNGVVLEAQASLQDACDADAVLVGSGLKTRDVAADAALMSQLRLDPTRQPNRGSKKPAWRCSTSHSWRSRTSRPQAGACRRSIWRPGLSRVWRVSRLHATRFST
jgi:hypothetical protein